MDSLGRREGGGLGKGAKQRGSTRRWTGHDTFDGGKAKRKKKNKPRPKEVLQKKNQRTDKGEHYVFPY